MYLNDNNIPHGFFECPFNPKFLIFKNTVGWELCLKEIFNEDGYPKIIGYVNTYGDKGFLTNACNLGWMIESEYRGCGYMKQLLEMFIREFIPDESLFAVKIQKNNMPSIKLALSQSFDYYHEDDFYYYMKRNV